MLLMSPPVSWLQHTGIRVARGLPCPRQPQQGQGCPKSPSFHPRLLFTLCRFILLGAGGLLAALGAPALGGQPEAKAVSRALWLPGLCPTRRLPELIWISHRSCHSSPELDFSSVLQIPLGAAL